MWYIRMKPLACKPLTWEITVFDYFRKLLYAIFTIKRSSQNSSSILLWRLKPARPEVKFLKLNQHCIGALNIQVWETGSKKSITSTSRVEDTWSSKFRSGHINTSKIVVSAVVHFHSYKRFLHICNKSNLSKPCSWIFHY